MDEEVRPLFVFWQFNGDNSSYCNLKCPYCYQLEKHQKHEWNNKPLEWEQALERLNRPLYLNVCYGEPMLAHGFYDILDMIGRHPDWECNLITNLSTSPEKMLNTQVARDGRLYVIASWHPLGGADWSKFQSHLLVLQSAEIKTLVMFVLYPPQIESWKQAFPWLDNHNIRTYIRRYYGRFEKKTYPQAYSQRDKDFLMAMANHPWSIKYCVNMTSPKRHLCYAGADKILIHSDGQVSTCADVANDNLGNIFNPDFKLGTDPHICMYHTCGGDHGMLHMVDPEIGDPPDSFGHDCFPIVGTGIRGGGREPVYYPNRDEMMKWFTA